MCILCILIPILVGLICALLGYFLGRLIEKKSEVYVKLRADLDNCNKENERQLALNSSLKSDVDSWSKKFNLLQSDFEAYKLKSIARSSKGLPFDSALAASLFERSIVEDDLKIVEGIGPKIEELFHNAGISTWKALAETAIERCQKVLDNAGDNYKLHKPETWPKQAEMAYLGKWKELKEWQDKMDGGKK